MDESSTQAVSSQADAPLGPDRLSLRRWLAVYVAWLVALAAPAAWRLAKLGAAWKELFVKPEEFRSSEDAAAKLLIFAVYISLCHTFLPLPTGWLVSLVATRDAALSDSFLITVVLVASVGAAASTMANLHDYHVFTWMLRHRRVARVRQTRLYHGAASWFARQPFSLLVIFNVIPIPVDVIRMLAATYRYPLRPFAAANFLGRWVRYAVIAAVTFQMGRRGWLISAALLAAAVLLGLGKVAGRLRPRPDAAGQSPPPPAKMDG